MTIARRRLKVKVLGQGQGGGSVRPRSSPRNSKVKDFSGLHVVYRNFRIFSNKSTSAINIFTAPISCNLRFVQVIKRFTGLIT